MKPVLGKVKMKKVVFLCFYFLLVTPWSHAQELSVVASIKPLQLIALEVTKNITEPGILLSSTASPHDYALKPSDLKKIKKADLVIWFGPDLEAFLSKAIGSGDNALKLSESGISLRDYKQDAHDHHGHDHGNYDPHIWLGPKQAAQTAEVIMLKLSEIDPRNAERYQANYHSFISQLNKVTDELKQQLAPYKEKGYYVFHDAYGYYESYFSLNKQGYFTLSPERKPGAKTLIHIRTALKEGKARCLFSEPQFKPSVVKSVTRGSDVYIGVLDPLATEVDVKPGGYLVFLKALTQSYVDCLAY